MPTPEPTTPLRRPFVHGFAGNLGVVPPIAAPPTPRPWQINPRTAALFSQSRWRVSRESAPVRPYPIARLVPSHDAGLADAVRLPPRGPSGCASSRRTDPGAATRPPAPGHPVPPGPWPAAALAEPVQRFRRLHQHVPPHAPRAVRALPVALEQTHQIEVQHWPLLGGVSSQTQENQDAAMHRISERVLTSTHQFRHDSPPGCAEQLADWLAGLKVGAEGAPENACSPTAPRGRGTGRRAKL